MSYNNIQGIIGEWYSKQTPELQREFITWIYSELNTRTVPLSFKKADDTIRNMNCTLQESIIPGDTGIPEDIMNTTAENHVIVVWDTDISAWRSFRVDRLINVE